MAGQPQLTASWQMPLLARSSGHAVAGSQLQEGCPGHAVKGASCLAAACWAVVPTLRDQCGYCLLNSARPKVSAAGVHPALTEVVFPIPRLPQLPPDPRNVLASGPKEAHSLQRSAGSCYSCWH